MAMGERIIGGAAFTRDGMFELLVGVALALAGWLLLPAMAGRADLAPWVWLPLVVAALLLPICKGLLLRLAIRRGWKAGPRAAGWGWLLLLLGGIILAGVALVLVWVELDNPLLSVAVSVILWVWTHATAVVGLLVGLTLILIGGANRQLRVALEGTLWAVSGLLLDAAIWSGLLSAALGRSAMTRSLLAAYLIALGGLTALAGLAALVRWLMARPAVSAGQGMDLQELAAREVSVEGLLADTRRQVRRAYYADGLFDLIMGLGILVASGMLLVGQAALWYLPLLLTVTTLPAAKKRWVQPRSGYVLPERPERGRLRLIVALVALLLLVSLIMGLSRYGEQWPVLVMMMAGAWWVLARFGLICGLICGAAILWNGLDLGIVRLKVYGMGFMAAGLLCLWNGAGLALRERLPEPELFGAVFFGVLGAAMAIVGAVRFWRFLQENPPQNAEVDGDG